MKPWRVVAGLAIVVGLFAFTSPIWVAILRFCPVDDVYESGSVDGLYYGCSTAISQVIALLPLFIPGIGIGIWITIFALKDISFVTFKKEPKQAA